MSIGGVKWWGASALAISNFLRQHDLGQVQWVFLRSDRPDHPSETRHI
jgi:hypothetical protein